MTCKDCLYYPKCEWHIDEETTMTVNECKDFKDQSRFIELPEMLKNKDVYIFTKDGMWIYNGIDINRLIQNAVDGKVIELPCRCQECIHSMPLDNHCELNSSAYLHCKLWRGEKTKYVWHKYKKYYKDYSIVDRDGYCDQAEKALKERESK